MTEAEILDPIAKAKRPTEFSDEIFETICERMEGGDWLRKICDNDPQMPSRQTFLRWLEKDTGRQARYRRAGEAMIDYWAETLLDMAQETEKDTIVDDKGRRRCNFEWAASKRLHSENLRFLMSKIYPKRYGDRPETIEMPAPQFGPAVVSFPRVIVYPMLRHDGSLIRHDTPEYDEAIQRAALQALSRGETCASVGIRLTPEPEYQRPPVPAQITFQPDPLPGDLSPEDWSLLSELLNLIRRTVPADSNAMPGPIFNVIRAALLLHYREVELEGSQEEVG